MVRVRMVTPQGTVERNFLVSRLMCCSVVVCACMCVRWKHAPFLLSDTTASAAFACQLLVSPPCVQ